MADTIYNSEDIHPLELNGYAIVEERMNGSIDNFHLGRRINMPHYRIDIYKGEDRTLRAFVKDKCLNIINVSGATGVLNVKDKKGGTLAFTKSTSIAAEGAIGSPERGEMFFYILPANTDSLDIKQGVFDISVTLASGKKYTILEGIITFLEVV